MWGPGQQLRFHVSQLYPLLTPRLSQFVVVVTAQPSHPIPITREKENVCSFHIRLYTSIRKKAEDKMPSNAAIDKAVRGDVIRLSEHWVAFFGVVFLSLRGVSTLPWLKSKKIAEGFGQENTTIWDGANIPHHHSSLLLPDFKNRPS